MLNLLSLKDRKGPNKDKNVKQQTKKHKIDDGNLWQYLNAVESVQLRSIKNFGDFYGSNLAGVKEMIDQIHDINIFNKNGKLKGWQKDQNKLLDKRMKK